MKIDEKIIIKDQSLHPNWEGQNYKGKHLQSVSQENLQKTSLNPQKRNATFNAQKKKEERNEKYIFTSYISMQHNWWHELQNLCFLIQASI